VSHARPLASVIISNFNGGELLRESLESLLKQEYPNLEVIVVDAGSTDGSTAMVAKEFPEVVLIPAETRIGIGEAINVGIKQAKGEVIVFDFNSDEIATSTWLRRLVEVLYSSPKIGIVGGTRILYGTNGVIDDAGMRIHFFGHMSKIGRWRKYKVYGKQPKDVDYLNCFVVGRELVNKVGPLDETYEIYGEDADYCLRVKRCGYRVVQVPDAVTYHKGNASVGSETPSQVYFCRRAEIRIALKLYPMPKMLLALLWACFRTTIDAALLFPPFTKLVSTTPYSHLARRRTLKHFRASLEAITWNFAMVRQTIADRFCICKQSLEMSSIQAEETKSHRQPKANHEE